MGRSGLVTALMFGMLMLPAFADGGTIQYDPATGTYYNNEPVVSQERGQKPANKGDFVEYMAVPLPGGTPQTAAPMAAPAPPQAAAPTSSGYAAWPPTSPPSADLQGYPYAYGGYGGYGYGVGGFGGGFGSVFVSPLPSAFNFTSFTPFPFTLPISTNPFAPATIVAAPFPFPPPIPTLPSAINSTTGTIIPFFRP